MLLVLAAGGAVENNRCMSFADEFEVLDPVRIERAYANVAEKLLQLASRGPQSAGEMIEIFGDIRQVSAGYAALIGRHEETIQMVSETPGLEYSPERFHLLQMNLGLYAAGLVLAEYARLEAEGD